MQHSSLNQAHAAALERWRTPYLGFTSGQDPRTSDNALLVQLYGGLERASRHAWLNAGRRLIDKTYVDMVWHVQDLTTMRACRPEQTAAALDGFIQGTISQVWDLLPAMSRGQKSELAQRWVDNAAGQLFGSLHSEPAASRLLFFLCPVLPVYNLSRGHLLALEGMGHTPEDDTYPACARAAETAYRQLAPELRRLPQPIPSYGNEEEQALIQRLLEESDWWPRRVFDELLRQALPRRAADTQNPFGCDGAGQLTT